MENSKSLLIGLGILVLVVLAYAGYRAMNPSTLAPEPTATTTPAEELPMTLNVKHFFDGATHIYHGVVETPTPCYDVIAEARSTDNGASYDIIITTKDRGEVCAQVVTDKEFELSFKGSPYRVGGILNGTPVQLNIVEVYSKDELPGPFDFKS